MGARGCSQPWEGRRNTSWSKGGSSGRTWTRQSRLPGESWCSHQLGGQLQSVAMEDVRAPRCRAFWDTPPGCGIPHWSIWPLEILLSLLLSAQRYFCGKAFSNTCSTEEHTPKQLNPHTSAARIASGGKVLRNYTDEQRVKNYQEQEELGTWEMEPKVTCLYGVTCSVSLLGKYCLRNWKEGIQVIFMLDILCILLNYFLVISDWLTFLYSPFFLLIKL